MDLTFSIPVVEIVLVIQALKWCKEAIGLVFKDHVHMLGLCGLAEAMTTE